jgi:hypothetical protein
MKLSICAILCVTVVVIAVPQNPLDGKSKWNVGQRVKTSSGPVDGHPAPNATEVSEYLGIPFAKPPVGDLRFEPPQPYIGKSVINGSNFVSQTSIIGPKSMILTTPGPFMSTNHSHCGGHPTTIRFCSTRHLDTSLPILESRTDRSTDYLIRRLSHFKHLDEASSRRQAQSCTPLDLRWWFRNRRDPSKIQLRPASRRRR